LRHICQTIGEEAGDKAAIEYILGHAPPAEDMASVYRERMAPKRLFKVCRHIRKWLGIAKKKPAKPAKETAKQVARATRKPKPEPAKQVAGPTRKPAKQVTACPALQIAASRATTVPVV
jgi:Sec-independent protein translocase protein TatA